MTLPHAECVHLADRIIAELWSPAHLAPGVYLAAPEGSTFRWSRESARAHILAVLMRESRGERREMPLLEGMEEEATG